MKFALAATALLSAGTWTSPVATLRVDGDQSTFMVKVIGDDAAGYQIAIDCSERCATPVYYQEAVADTPLGLFSRDQNDLVFSIWSGGSAYRVLIWSVAHGSVRKVAELSSRGRPDFLTGPDGGPVIQTYDGDGSSTQLRGTRWIFANDRFVRSD